jgi:hypothetical protein
LNGLGDASINFLMDDEIERLREAFNKAHREWKQSPDEETKAVMKAASSAFNAAKIHSQLPPLGPPRVPPADEHPLLTEARKRRNEALQATYADPSPETKQAELDAQNDYKRLRLLYDPEFRAKQNEAQRRWRAKKKLGSQAPE